MAFRARDKPILITLIERSGIKFTLLVSSGLSSYFLYVQVLLSVPSLYSTTHNTLLGYAKPKVNRNDEKRFEKEGSFRVRSDC